jgi:hypothetical protein
MSVRNNDRPDFDETWLCLEAQLADDLVRCLEDDFGDDRDSIVDWLLECRTHMLGRPRANAHRIAAMEAALTMLCDEAWYEDQHAKQLRGEPCALTAFAEFLALEALLDG